MKKDELERIATQAILRLFPGLLPHWSLKLIHSKLKIMPQAHDRSFHCSVLFTCQIRFHIFLICERKVSWLITVLSSGLLNWYKAMVCPVNSRAAPHFRRFNRWMNQRHTSGRQPDNITPWWHNGCTLSCTTIAKYRLFCTPAFCRTKKIWRIFQCTRYRNLRGSTSTWGMQTEQGSTKYLFKPGAEKGLE